MDFHSFASLAGLGHGAGFHRVVQEETSVSWGSGAGAVARPGSAFLTRVSFPQCKPWPRPTLRSFTEPRSEGLLRPLRSQFPTLAPCPCAPMGMLQGARLGAGGAARTLPPCPHAHHARP